MRQLAAVLDGDADAMRSAYAIVERECRPHPHLWEVVESWGDELAVLRGAV